MTQSVKQSATVAINIQAIDMRVGYDMSDGTTHGHIGEMSVSPISNTYQDNLCDNSVKL